MSIYLKPALCALVAGVVAPLIYLFSMALLDDRVTALGAYVRSDGGGNEVERYGGAFALVFVVMPVLALVGAMNAALVWRREWSFRARRGWSGVFAVLSGLCVVPLAYVAPYMVQSNIVGRAVPDASRANSIVHGIVNFESWSPVVWATVLCAFCVWSWYTTKTR